MNNDDEDDDDKFNEVIIILTKKKKKVVTYCLNIHLINEDKFFYYLICFNFQFQESNSR